MPQYEYEGTMTDLTCSVRSRPVKAVSSLAHNVMLIDPAFGLDDVDERALGQKQTKDEV